MRYLPIEFNEKFDNMAREYANYRSLTNEEMPIIYILSQVPSLYNSRDRILNFEKQQIIPQSLDSGIWSSGERAMIKLGYNLFNNYKGECQEEGENYSPIGLFWALDKDNVNIALNALSLRFK